MFLPSIPGINCGDEGVKTTVRFLQPVARFLVQPNVILFAPVQTNTFKATFFAAPVS